MNVAGKSQIDNAIQCLEDAVDILRTIQGVTRQQKNSLAITMSDLGYLVKRLNHLKGL